MASFKITDLTELAGGSVNDSDVLEIVDLDADQSKKVTIASLKTVFAGSGVSEGSSYTGGTANGIMFNDGDTFATDSGFIYDQPNQKAYIENIDVEDKFRIKNGGVDALRAYSSGSWISIVVPSSYTAQVEGGNWSFGSWNSNPDARININLGSDQIGQKIDLSNGQTADAFQINSYGNTGGDLLKVTSDGYLGLNVTSPTNVFHAKAIGAGDGGIRIDTLLGYTSINWVSNNIGIGLRAGGGLGFKVGSNSGAYFNKYIGSPTARVHIVTESDENGLVAEKIDLGSGQTADAFQINSYGNTGGDLFRVTSDGYLGVNNTNPQSEVDAVGDIRVREVSGSTVSSILLQTASSVGGRIILYNPSNTASVVIPSNGNTTFNGGNVGIGTTSIDAKLHTSLSTDVVGYRLDLSNGQTADAFQINSYGNTGGDLFGIESDGLIRSQISTSNTIGQVHHNFPNAYSITNLATLTSNKYSAFFGYYTGVKNQGLYIGTNSTGSGFIQNVDGTSAYRFSIQPYGGGLTVGSTAGMPNNKTFEVNGDSYFKNNVGIGTTSPDASSILDLTSTTKGVLLPRMTTTERNAISSPANGLLIYNTTANQFQYYNSGLASWAAV